MKRRSIDGVFPDSLKVILSKLGEDIGSARRARNMSQEDLAARISVHRNTVVRIEAGDNRVSLGAVAAAAWVMGMEKALADIFSPEKDREFYRDARLRQPERVREAPADTPDLDF